MKKGVSPLIAVVLLIVIGIGLVAIVVPMVRQPTEKTMNEASETTSRILGCKDIKFDVDRICQESGQVKIFVENLKNNEIYNFFVRFVSSSDVRTYYPWNCESIPNTCIQETDQSLCYQGIGSPYVAHLGAYSSLKFRTYFDLENPFLISEITTIDVIPVLVNENKLDNCNDAAKKVIINGVLNNC